jgi:hypothetical protein
MRCILLALSITCGLLLSGCAGYDRFAEPSASLALDRAMDRCRHSPPQDQSQKHSEFMACELAAERDFALATRTERMDAFAVYARQMQQVAADWDAQKLSPEQATLRRDDILRQYVAACDCTIGPTSPRWDMSVPAPLGMGGTPN